MNYYKYKITIPYRDGKTRKVFDTKFDVSAENEEHAKKIALTEFSAYENYTSATWTRVPLLDKIKVEKQEKD